MDTRDRCGSGMWAPGCTTALLTLTCLRGMHESIKLHEYASRWVMTSYRPTTHQTIFQTTHQTTHRRPTLYRKNRPSACSTMRAERLDNLHESASCERSRSTLPRVLLLRPNSTAEVSIRYWWLRLMRHASALKGRGGVAPGSTIASRDLEASALAACVDRTSMDTETPHKHGLNR